MTLTLNPSDLIVAPATAPGIAAIGIVRLSGPGALQVAGELFRGTSPEQAPSHTLHHGWWTDGERPLDEVLVSVFRAPASYTGEDIIEISCHGSPYIMEQVVRSCVARGARLARPGEFTQRAFLNGKLDLTQAEAVADLIASGSAAAHRTALNNLRGRFSDKLKALREQLILFRSLMELELDFSQEDIEFADRQQLYRLLDEAEAEVGRLVQSFGLGNAVRQGVSVAIVGPPNAGKSTLLNALLNEERAIVSDIAGTTRDTIEEVLNIRGILFRLIDTAGIRDHSSDVIETAGIGRSLDKMRSADIVVYLFDVAEEPDTLQVALHKLTRENIRYLAVGNKADTADLAALQEKFLSIPDLLFVSAKEESGMEDLKDRLYHSIVQEGLNTEDTLLTNARHLEAMEKVMQSLQEIREGLDKHLSGDLITPDIQRCLHYLGSITGEIQTDRDILGTIFSKFCIGK